MVASLGLPHWLMIAGTLLVVAGFVGVLVSGKKAKELSIFRRADRCFPPADAAFAKISSTPGQRTTPSHRLGFSTGLRPSAL